MFILSFLVKPDDDDDDDDDDGMKPGGPGAGK